MSGGDKASLLRIVLDKGPVNGPEVGIVLIFGKSQLDVVHQLVDLRVEFYSEEGHVYF